MTNEVINQITQMIGNALNSKHGPFYAGLLAITGFSLGYIFIDNKYGISDGERCIQPQQQVEIGEAIYEE